LIFTIPVILSALLNVSSQKIFSGLFSFIWIFCFNTFDFLRSGSLYIT
jgi:hypothetical protein